MKTRFWSVLFSAGLCLPTAQALHAQTKTLPGEMKTVTATVEAVEAASRTVTLKGLEGN